MNNTSVAFKRVAIGSRFNHNGENFRKFSAHEVFKLLPSGTGQTDRKIRFANSTKVNVVE